MMRSLLPLILAVSWAWAEPGAEPDTVIVGEARALDSGVWLYREEHRFSDQGRSHQVQYFDGDNQRFAEKQLHYGESWWSPSVRQSNNWAGESI